MCGAKFIKKLDDCEISAFIIGEGANIEENKKILSQNGFDKVYIANSPELKTIRLIITQISQ